MEGRSCEVPFCDDPENDGCNLGHLLSDCKHFRKGASREKAQKGSENGVGLSVDRDLRLPWTGNSLGLRDLERVASSRAPLLIGVIGPFNSGKTSLLTLMYLLLLKGASLEAGVFAGSTSLIGWENLAANLRWKPGEGGPRFPPHTSRTAGRRPGMLHMSLRAHTGERREVLLTDPPGEWFSSWAQHESAENADGARWIADRAERFLFLVDREALAVPVSRGKARDSIRDLARRLGARLAGRSVAVVWTKSDQDIPPVIEQDLKECFSTSFPDHTEFHVQMRFGNESEQAVEGACLALMNWAFGARERRIVPPLALPVIDKQADDFLLAFRGREDRQRP